MPEDSSDDGDGWLVSYADMMTLIACFFILMMAFANFDPVGFQEKTKELAKHFNKDKYKNSMTKMIELTEEIAKHPELEQNTKVTVHDTNVVISFSGTVLFEGGGYLLNKNSTLAVDTLIDIIKTLDPNFQIIVEGHTDNRPISNQEGNFRSNWSLAGARAASVVERFEYFGFNPGNLKAVSWGDTKPLLPNEDSAGNPLEDNIKMNRRVVIKVIQPLDNKRKYKIGLGVYFD